MSRSYRISVRECINRTIEAEDRVSTELEILEILPKEQMAELLAGELEKGGFRREGDTLVREDDKVIVVVETKTGKVTISSGEKEETKVEGEMTGRAYEDVGNHAAQVRENLRKELGRSLEKKVEDKQTGLQTKVTERLEGQLGDIRQELDQAVNRVTAEALKRKAAQLGQIKEMTEDPQAGSLTIVVEV